MYIIFLIKNDFLIKYIMSILASFSSRLVIQLHIKSLTEELSKFLARWGCQL